MDGDLEWCLESLGTVAAACVVAYVMGPVVSIRHSVQRLLGAVCFHDSKRGVGGCF